MTPISRGLGQRRRDDVDPSRLPPGRSLRAWLPGPVGRADAAHARWEEWTFSIQGAGDEARSWTRHEFTARRRSM